jgi:hypothetical protein
VVDLHVHSDEADKTHNAGNSLIHSGVKYLRDISSFSKVEGCFIKRGLHN